MLLDSRGFDVGYGPVPIITDATFAVGPGEVVALIGRNGMGKTTLFRGIMGLAPVCRGSVRFRGIEITGKAPDSIARSGIGYVPAGRGIFGSLSVLENLVMRAATHDEPGQNFDNWTLERVLRLFPRLSERLNFGGLKLSGGEQQMLAIGRALMTNPQLLLIDEATEGLAPLVARNIWETLHEICKSGMAAIIVDRDLRRLAKVATRAIILSKGEIVFDGDPSLAMADEALIQRYVGL